MLRVPITVVLIVGLAAVGCNSRPRAPALLDDPVFENDQEGIRLEVPSGWVITAKTQLAPGEPILKEKKLVGYMRPHGGKPASFEVACLDQPPGFNLLTYFTSPGGGPDVWQASGTAEAITVGGLPAQRMAFERGAGASALRKEVVAVRRGGRLTFFTLVAAPNDAAARNEARRAVASVTWHGSPAAP